LPTRAPGERTILELDAIGDAHGGYADEGKSLLLMARHSNHCLGLGTAGRPRAGVDSPDRQFNSAHHWGCFGPA
jgi:hypothetical protein